MPYFRSALQLLLHSVPFVGRLHLKWERRLAGDWWFHSPVFRVASEVGFRVRLEPAPYPYVFRYHVHLQKGVSTAHPVSHDGLVAVTSPLHPLLERPQVHHHSITTQYCSTRQQRVDGPVPSNPRFHEVT